MNEPINLQRYAQLVGSMIPADVTFEPLEKDSSQIQVERGLRLPVVEVQSNQSIQIVDAAGHSRPVYRPLLVYSWLLAAEREDEIQASSGSLQGWIERLDDSIVSSLVFATSGMLLKNQTWSARAVEKFGHLIDHQQPSGAFFAEDSGANPETRWYEELIALHAMASYAVRVNDQRAEQAAQRNALFHLEETQPDHASAQPWGLLAFAQFAPPMADQILHALTMQYPAGVTGVPLLLLTDALYGLRRLIERA